MIKLIGAVMTGAACAFFGLRMRLGMKTRVKSLADICTSLEMLEGEIGFGMNKLKQAFERADINGLFKAAAGKIADMGAEKAWRQAVKDMKQGLSLTDADCSALMTLGIGIGKTDGTEQIKHIRYVKSLVAAQKEQAQNEYARTAKLYSTGGMLVGALIVIVLL